MICDAFAMFPKNTKRHCFVDNNPNFVLLLELNLKKKANLLEQIIKRSAYFVSFGINVPGRMRGGGTSW